MSKSDNLDDTAKRPPLVVEQDVEEPRATRPPSSASQRLEALKGANERVSLLLEQMLAAEEAEHAELVESAQSEDPKPLKIPNIDVALPTEGVASDDGDSSGTGRESTNDMTNGAVLEAKANFDRLDVGSGSIGHVLRHQNESEGFFGTIGASVARLLHLD